MTTESEDHATIALLAKVLMPEFQKDIGEDDLRALIQSEILLTAEEERRLTEMDPLAFRKTSGDDFGQIIQFPQIDQEYDLAVGFNRGGKDADFSEETREQIMSMRAKIVKRLKQEQSGDRSLVKGDHEPRD